MAAGIRSERFETRASIRPYGSGPGRACSRLLASASGADTALNSVVARIDLGRLTNLEISRRIENWCRDPDAIFGFGLLRNPKSHIARAATGLKSIQTRRASSASTPEINSGAEPKSNDDLSSPRIFHRDRPPRNGEPSANTTRPIPAARMQNEHIGQGSTVE